MKMNKKVKDIAGVNDHSIQSIENLPYPYVIYPKMYGAFIGFKKDENSQIYLCSCYHKAISNYLKFHTEFISIYSKIKKNAKFISEIREFPIQLINTLSTENASNDENIIHKFHFQDNLCHECNRKIPSFSYCSKMYGTLFKQNYGWYIKKMSYEMGIRFNAYPGDVIQIIPDSCPNEIIECLENYSEIPSLSANIISYKKGSFQETKQDRKIKKIIENEVRSKLKYKKVGECWINETLLYYQIKEMFPNCTITQHYRPDFLRGLEIDVFIHELNIGFEYQGIQHFQPLPFFGGESTFIKLKKRDELKREICKDNKIKLIYINHDENISSDLINKKLMR